MSVVKLWPIGNTSAPMLPVPSACLSLATISEGSPNSLVQFVERAMVQRLMTELSDPRYETWLTICGASCVASLLLAGTI
jgi:hypothetical protein